MHVSSQTFAGESVPVWNAEQHDRAEELTRKMDYGIFRQLRSLCAAKYMVTVVIDGGCIIKPDTEIKPGVWFFLLLDMCSKFTSGVNDVQKNQLQTDSSV